MEAQPGAPRRLVLQVKSGRFDFTFPGIRSRTTEILCRDVEKLGVTLLGRCWQDKVLPLQNPAGMRQTRSGSSSRPAGVASRELGGWLCGAGFGRASGPGRGQTSWALSPDSRRSAGAFPPAPAARERSFPSPALGGSCSGLLPCSVPKPQPGSARSANNKAPFVRVPFPKPGLPVAKLITLLRAVSDPALFSLGLGACRMSGRASWRGRRSPARGKGGLSRHDLISGTRACLYRSRQTPCKPKSSTGLRRSCRIRLTVPPRSTPGDMSPFAASGPPGEPALTLQLGLRGAAGATPSPPLTCRASPRRWPACSSSTSLSTRWRT